MRGMFFLRLAPLLLAAFPPSVAASPALDLYDAFADTVVRLYAGESTADLPDVTARFRTEAVAACADRAGACPADRAVPAIESALEAIGDPHNGLLPPEPPPGQGPRLSFGWKIRPLPDRHARVTYVNPDGPAAQAGIAQGDLLVSIEGHEDIASVRHLFLPPTGPLTFVVERDGQRRTLDVAPEPMRWARPPVLAWQDGVAVIRAVELDGPRAAEKFHQLVAEALAGNARAMAIDLRDNSGGSFHCMAAISSIVPAFERQHWAHGSVIRRSRIEGGRIEGQERGRPYGFAVREPALWIGPVAVLVDGGTMSCAEVFAAEVQRSGHGRVYGTPTFGVANSANDIVELPFGYAVSLVTALHGPAGAGVAAPRVVPDVLVGDADEDFVGSADPVLARVLMDFTR